MFEGKQTDTALLRKFITLQPAPVEADWSVTTIGDGVFGPSDTEFWAVLRYSDPDFATLSRALKAGEELPPVTLGTAPAWLLAEIDPAQFRHGSDHVFEGPVYDGRPFASKSYSNGFALVLPSNRVLVQFSTQ